MKVFFLNNDGGGFTDQIEVTQVTTLGKLFGQRIPGRNAVDYLIRLNHQPAVAEELLSDGCRVNIIPVKIEGAAA
jgi:hypothetical protein